MSRVTEYCNITTDLQSVCKNIETYGYQTIDPYEFSAVSGEDYSEQGQTGYVGALYINRKLKTQASGTSTISSSTPWYYDSTNDVLYLLTTLVSDTAISILPDTWENIKKTAREDASQELENYFRGTYTIPFPYKRNSTLEFDDDIKRMVAIMTCMNIIRSDNPNNEILEAYNNMLWDNDNLNSKGMLQAYLDGRKNFSFEATRATFNGLVTPNSVSGSGALEVLGQHLSNDYAKYEIEFTTGGAVGTAKYQLTKNNVVIGTYNTYIYYVNLLLCDIYIRLSGEFEIGDKWTIEFDGRRNQVKSGMRTLKIVH